MKSIKMFFAVPFVTVAYVFLGLGIVSARCAEFFMAIGQKLYGKID